MDIVVWLRSLGLGKYEAVFRENDIDETVLRNLTAEDLKELGIASLGHRRKLLDAIAALRSDVSGKTPPVDAGTTSSTPSRHPEDRAERRQVTVMFADLVGSTALSARMDPEDLGEVKSALLRRCSASVGSWRNTWAMGSWSILDTRGRTRTTQNEPFAGWYQARAKPIPGLGVSSLAELSRTLSSPIASRIKVSFSARGTRGSTLPFVVSLADCPICTPSSVKRVAKHTSKKMENGRVAFTSSPQR
jgi:hypothetical protein